MAPGDRARSRRPLPEVHAHTPGGIQKFRGLLPGDRVRPQIFTRPKFGEKRALLSQWLQNSPDTAHIRPVQRKQACMCRMGTGVGNESPRSPIWAASMLLPAVKRKPRARAGSFRWEDVDGKEETPSQYRSGRLPRASADNLPHALELTSPSRPLSMKKDILGETGILGI